MSSRSDVRLTKYSGGFSLSATLRVVACGLALGLAAPAFAQEGEQHPGTGGAAPAASTSPPEAVVAKGGDSRGPLGHVLLIYGKVGGVIPITPLGPNAAVRLGVGYVAPFLGGRLGIIADIGYQQMRTSKTLSDPRVGASGSGSWNYKVTQHDLNLFIGPQFYILDRRSRWVPYVAAGVDVNFLRTDVEGTGAKQPFGNNQETATKVGFAARAGLGVRLGPGMVNGEVAFAWAPLNNAITGSSNLGRINLLLGYTLMIGFGGG